MIAAIAGGKLQGVEASYLARKAGWRVWLLDQADDCPASGLSDRLIPCDLRDPNQVAAAIKGADVLIPALEDRPVLTALTQAAARQGIPIAFDPAAYAVSSSKSASNRLFKRLGLPMPPDWPGCGMPVVVKPDSASGSSGVQVVYDRNRVKELLAAQPGQVVQGFTPGPSYSIEVLGMGGRYQAMQITDLFIDPDFDCKRVTAPTSLEAPLAAELERMALVIAEALGLNGIMDLEVIRQGGRLYILEIDARLPSQTPTAVFQSRGHNFVTLLAQAAMDGRLPDIHPTDPPAAVIYEHILVSPGRLRVLGEHIMGSAGPLTLIPGFMGADEALTNHGPERFGWAATMIYREANQSDAGARRNRVMSDLCDRFDLLLEDEEP